MAQPKTSMVETPCSVPAPSPPSCLCHYPLAGVQAHLAFFCAACAPLFLRKVLGESFLLCYFLQLSLLLVLRFLPDIWSLEPPSLRPFFPFLLCSHLDPKGLLWSPGTTCSIFPITHTSSAQTLHESPHVEFQCPLGFLQYLTDIQVTFSLTSNITSAMRLSTSVGGDVTLVWLRPQVLWANWASHSPPQAPSHLLGLCFSNLSGLGAQTSPTFHLYLLHAFLQPPPNSFSQFYLESLKSVLSSSARVAF
jgi:hypothetical protein